MISDEEYGLMMGTLQAVLLSAALLFAYVADWLFGFGFSDFKLWWLPMIWICSVAWQYVFGEH